jgi:hypothetical protein
MVGSTIAWPEATVVSDKEMPDPAREALDEPPLGAEELEREIGDSEHWDEASEPDADSEDIDSREL